MKKHLYHNNSLRNNCKGLLKLICRKKGNYVIVSVVLHIDVKTRDTKHEKCPHKNPPKK